MHFSEHTFREDRTEITFPLFLQLFLPSRPTFISSPFLLLLLQKEARKRCHDSPLPIFSPLFRPWQMSPLLLIPLPTGSSCLAFLTPPPNRRWREGGKDGRPSKLLPTPLSLPFHSDPPSHSTYPERRGGIWVGGRDRL